VDAPAGASCSPPAVVALWEGHETGFSYRRAEYRKLNVGMAEVVLDDLRG